MYLCVTFQETILSTAATAWTDDSGAQKKLEKAVLPKPKQKQDGIPSDRLKDDKSEEEVDDGVEQEDCPQKEERCGEVLHEIEEEEDEQILKAMVKMKQLEKTLNKKKEVRLSCANKSHFDKESCPLLIYLLEQVGKVSHLKHMLFSFLPFGTARL